MKHFLHLCCHNVTVGYNSIKKYVFLFYKLFEIFTFAAAFSGSRERLKAEGSKCT